MNLDVVREYCLSFPGASEMVQWEESLLFKVGGKIFVIFSLNEGAENKMSLKCTSDKFNEMIENEGVIPAPYLARNNWICLQKSNRLRTSEIKELIKNSYELVFKRLPKKIKREIK